MIQYDIVSRHECGKLWGLFLHCWSMTANNTRRHMRGLPRGEGALLQKQLLTKKKNRTLPVILWYKIPDNPFLLCFPPSLYLSCRTMYLMRCQRRVFLEEWFWKCTMYNVQFTMNFIVSFLCTYFVIFPIDFLSIKSVFLFKFIILALELSRALKPG